MSAGHSKLLPTMARVDPSLITRFYRRQQVAIKPRLAVPEPCTVSNAPTGLGDAVVLTALPRRAHECGRVASIYSFSPHFPTLLQFNPYYRPGLTPHWILATRVVEDFDLGGGHIIQRLERACGLPPDLIPRGCLVVDRAQRVPGRTILHFEPGPTARNIQIFLHPRPREVYPEHMAALQTFILRHPEMHFAEVGQTFSGLRGVEDWTGRRLTETVQNMASAEFFIGIDSGPMHIAAALGLKMVTILNIQDPTKLYLPCLREFDTLLGLYWLYPQSVLLHEDGEGELVAYFSLDNLERAIAGELYPYWSDEYLSLLFDERALASTWK
jgi:hypothetical protein